MNNQTDLEELNYFIESLNSSDIGELTATLQTLYDSPIADMRILSHIQSLLSNKEACVAARPYMYAEIAYLAAKALASTRKTLDIAEPVIWTVSTPLNTEQLCQLIEENSLPARGGIEGMLLAYNNLNKQQKIPMLINYHFTPKL